MVTKMNAKYHLERCLREEHDYSVGKAHCRLATLYKDYDPHLRDITELQFQVKWRRSHEAIPVLERLVKSHSTSDQAWSVIHQMFMTAASQSTSVERDVFMELSTDILEAILSGLSKRFDSNDALKTRLLLFAVQTSAEEKHTKIMVRAITYFTDKVNSDKDTIAHGIGKYHIYIAFVIAPVLLKRHLTGISASRMFNIIMTTIHVALVWRIESARAQFEELLNEISSEGTSPCGTVNPVESFASNSWDMIGALIDKAIQTTDSGQAEPVLLPCSSMDSTAILKFIDKTIALKADCRKLLIAYFVWRAYSVWRSFLGEDDLLAWQPTDNWSTDVDKIIDDKLDVTVERVSPSKKSRCSRGERKENLLHVPKPSPAPATISNSFKKELCDAYEMCAAAICSFAECRNGLECEQILQFVEEFGDVQQFVSESLLFKCKFDEAICQLNERLERLNDNGANSSTNASEGNAHESSASNDGVQNLKDVKTRSKEKRKEREIKKEIEEPPSETSVVTSKSPSETEAIKKESEIVYLQLACANAIARNWSDAYEAVCSVIRSISKDSKNRIKNELKENERKDDVNDKMDFNHCQQSSETSALTNHSDFVIIKHCDMEDLVYDILHHIFFKVFLLKVYTSTAVDHENDLILGALLVLSQVSFATKGFRSFNRIMRHIEAKGSLNYPGLVTHITNMAILEEISRVQEYCTEYVTIQVALPQVHRRIGQSTRHSVRGTKDGQRQSLEEQMKKWQNDPLETVSAFFIDERESILKILK